MAYILCHGYVNLVLPIDDAKTQVIVSICACFFETEFAYLELFKIEPFIFMSILFVILSETFART